jgi:hypothetical protein
MRALHIFLVVLGIGLGMSGLWLFQNSNNIERERIRMEEAEQVRAELSEALVQARARANGVEIIETTVIESVKGLSPREIIEKLGTVEANSPHFIQRRVVHYMEELLDHGPNAIPAIREFLAKKLDREYLTRKQTIVARIYSEEKRLSAMTVILRPLPRPDLNFVWPPSLRLGLMVVLLQIGGDEAEAVLYQNLKKSASGAEIAWLDVILDRIRPGHYRDEVLEIAREIVSNPKKYELPDKGYLDLQSNQYLMGLLIKHRDTGLVELMRDKLVNDDGRLEGMPVRYLHGVLGSQSLAILYPLFRDRKVKEMWDRRALRDLMLRHVGIAPQADELFRYQSKIPLI